MKRLRKYIIASVIALLAFSSTTSSQTQDPQPESPPPQPQASPTPPVKFFKKEKAIPNRYIVVLKDDVVSVDAPLKVRRARVAAIAKRHARTHRGKVDYIYETALKGYAIELPNEAAAIAISKLSEVKWVEEDALGSWSFSHQ